MGNELLSEDGGFGSNGGGAYWLIGYYGRDVFLLLRDDDVMIDVNLKKDVISFVSVLNLSFI